MVTLGQAVVFIKGTLSSSTSHVAHMTELSREITIQSSVEGQSGQKEHFLILINDFLIVINDLLILMNDLLTLRNIY